VVVCYLPQCKGKVIQGGHIVRHLKQTHHLEDEACYDWKNTLSEYIKDVNNPAYVDEYFTLFDSHSCKSKRLHLPEYRLIGQAFS
jgi:hypothetical protein